MLTNKQKQQIESIASIVDFVSKQEIIDKKDIEDIDIRLDMVLSSTDSNKKFFKRLIS